MRNPTLVIFALLLTLVLTGAKHTERNGGVAAGDIWCVAKNNADDTALQSAIDWACGPGGADCRPIQLGGSCYDPGDIQSHASYAFNDYFIRNGGAESACDFSGTAALTSLNPGHGSCQFPSSSSLKSGNVSSAVYGSTVGLGPSADLNSSPSICLDYIWFFMGTVYVILANLL
ncbi:PLASMODESMATA CALLOSE-BINDING PROTEIN 5 isoform X2 [Carex littledalei]|uniref:PLASMODESMATA CALLOSE-BINDING PROTEIN 5 isoform X2 n=1 Tax=Carex littledalei TaxID=544730 RepID=A0A833R4E3_9POAL|nr:PLASMODESMATA CALLOSE-BINDING PROTEIN 5 isoform X2 [Carex littledalei]